MQEAYEEGELVEIVIVNRSRRTYYYQRQYPACYNLEFFDDSVEQRPYPYADSAQQGRLLQPGQFIAPAGTHCDLVVEEALEPGGQASLLYWKQLVCTADRWGCLESDAVAPGAYRIDGYFSSKRGIVSPRPSGLPGDDSVAAAEWTFVIHEG